MWINRKQRQPEIKKKDLRKSEIKIQDLAKITLEKECYKIIGKMRSAKAQNHIRGLLNTLHPT